MLKKQVFWLKPLIGVLVITLITGLVWVGYLFNFSISKPISIGSSYMTMNNEFYPVVNEQIANYINNRQDFLYNRDPALSVSRQIEEIHSFIAKKVNVILLNPVDNKSIKLNRAINEAHKAGIKIIVVDSPIANKNVDCTITSDNYKAGILCARELLKKQKSAKILLLDQLNADSVVERMDGFLSTIKKAHNSKIKVVARLHTNGQSECSYPKVKHFLKKKQSFDTVMALNDRTAIGALAAINENKRKNSVYVYSVDGSQAMKKLIDSGHDKIFTVAQTPIKMGDQVAKIAYKLAHNKKVPRRITLPVTLITQQNVNNYGITGWQ